MRENEDFANDSVASLYIGKSYWVLKKPKMALPYFRKIVLIVDLQIYYKIH